jgi:hypothetical protein
MAAGRIDALVTVVGMLAGALAYILLYPGIIIPLDQIADYGEVMLPELTGVPRGVWTVAFVVIGIAGLAIAIRADPAGRAGEDTAEN